MKAGERIGDKLQSGLPPRSLWLDPLRARAIELSVFMIFFVVGVLLLGSGLLAAYEELRYTSPGTILGCRFNAILRLHALREKTQPLSEINIVRTILPGERSADRSRR